MTGSFISVNMRLVKLNRLIAKVNCVLFSYVVNTIFILNTV